MVKVMVIVDVPTNIVLDAVKAVDNLLLTDGCGTLEDDAEYEIWAAEIVKE